MPSARTAPPTADELGLMRGTPPTDGQLVTLANWLDPPFHRWSFQHVRELIPTVPISRGEGPVWRLASDPAELTKMRLRAGRRALTFGRLLDETYTDAVAVLHRGRIVFEEYRNGMTPKTRHLLMSTTKSVTGTIAGILIGRGLLRPEQQVITFLPELSGTNFEGCTVRHLLDMRAGIAEGPQPSGARPYLQIYLWQTPTEAGPPRGITSYFPTLLSNRPHGSDFVYTSILTNVLAWVLERATSLRFPDLVARELWQHLGAEHDAEITVDGHGNAMADVGLSCTLRDFARFGELMRRGGRRGRDQVVPGSWVADTLTPEADSEAAFAAFGKEDLPDPGSYYRNQWWVQRGAAHGGVYMALGIHGQMVFIHNQAETVVAKFSTWPDYWSPAYLLPTARGCIDLAEQIAGLRP